VLYEEINKTENFKMLVELFSGFEDFATFYTERDSNNLAPNTLAGYKTLLKKTGERLKDGKFT
jgi:hypothetical protein